MTKNRKSVCKLLHNIPGYCTKRQCGRCIFSRIFRFGKPSFTIKIKDPENLNTICVYEGYGLVQNRDNSCSIFHMKTGVLEALVGYPTKLTEDEARKIIKNFLGSKKGKI